MALAFNNLFRDVTRYIPVLSVGANTAPGGPAVDDRHVVGTAPIGVWAGRANNVARWDGVAWVFTAPSTSTAGWRVWLTPATTNISSLYGWSGAAWVKLIDLTTTPNPAFLHWGSNAISSTTSTRYLQPGYDSALAPLTAIQYRAPAACKLRNMRVRHNTPAGNGLAVVYTLRINGVASALTVSMASTATDGSNLVNTVAVAAGDLIDIEVTKAASIGATPNDIVCAVEVIAP